MNGALTKIVLVRANKLVHGPTGTTAGSAIDTVAQLQRLLDKSPSTAVYLQQSRFEVIADGNHTGIAIRSNQSLILDDNSAIWCNSTLPVPL